MNYEKHYNEKSFWNKIGNIIGKAGSKPLLKAVTMYYCLIDSDTPVWVKTSIIGALGYLICPLDAVPDILGPVGLIDDFGVLATVYGTISAYITDEHIEKAENKLNSFGFNF